MRFDDELLAFAWDRSYFQKPRHLEINQLETATERAEPFLRIPNPALGVGVVLVHGFLASPAEMRPFGEKLVAAGFPVVGVRLKGHGTSPWDLHGRGWLEWLESLRRGFAVMSGFVDRIVVVGFSAGGTLALRLAAEQPDGLVGIAVVSAPMLFRNRNMRFVPLVHGANEFLRLVSPGERAMSFRPNQPENPQINYRSIPIRGLYELRHLVDAVRATLANVHCDALVIQGTEDPVIDPGSAEIIFDGLGSKNKTLKAVDSTQHAILFNDIGGTQDMIQSFLLRLTSETRPRRPSKMEPAAVSI
jgi:esterase/lipase